MICSQESFPQAPDHKPDKISLGGIQTEPMLRFSKKLKPRARRTNGKRKGLEDMKDVLVFGELQWAKLSEENPFWTFYFFNFW
jgi:hypothetical protein